MGLRQIFAVVAVLATGCAGAEGAANGQPAPGTTSSTVATVTVTTEQRHSPRGPVFTEGALPQVELVDAAGHRYTVDPDSHDTFTFSGLEPGTYRLEGALRPCDGNCGYLDPPTGKCQEMLTVDGDREVHVTFIAKKPCRVDSR